METPIGTIDTKLMESLDNMIQDFQNEFFPHPNDNIRIYMSLAIQRIILMEQAELWKYSPVELKEYRGYTVLPDYNHRITIVDIGDMEFKRLKQLRIQYENK